MFHTLVPLALPYSPPPSPAQQAEGQLDLREQYLDKVRELVGVQLRHDHEARRAARLAAELEAVLSRAALAEEEAARHKSWIHRCAVRRGVECGVVWGDYQCVCYQCI